MAPSNVLTWFADPAAPHDVRGDAAAVRAIPGSVLPDSGLRPLPFDQGNALLPLGIWGPGASNYSLLDDSVITFNLNGGGAKKADHASARRRLKRSGFSYAADTAQDPAGLLARVEAAQRTLERNPGTSLAIVLTADWRVVGEHIAKHPDKLRLIEHELAKVVDEIRFSKTVVSARKSAVVAKQVLAKCAKGAGVCASYNDGQASASIEHGPGGVAKRITVTDLRLTPTITFVAGVTRSLGLRVTDATVIVVDGKELADRSLVALLAALTMPTPSSARPTPKAATPSSAPKPKSASASASAAVRPARSATVSRR